MRSIWMILVGCLAIPLSIDPLEAQRATRGIAPLPAELTRAARLRAPTEPLVARAASSPQLVVARPSRKQGETLMIVGGAVLLVGLLADETIISIAGVAVGAYGLYVYLNASPKRR